MYILVAYNSRSMAMNLLQNLKMNGVYGSIVNTPKNVATSCGISVRATIADKDKIMQIVSSLGQYALIGVYVMDEYGRIAERLNIIR